MSTLEQYRAMRAESRWEESTSYWREHRAEITRRPGARLARNHWDLKAERNKTESGNASKRGGVQLSAPQASLRDAEPFLKVPRGLVDLARAKGATCWATVPELRPPSEETIHLMEEMGLIED